MASRLDWKVYTRDKIYIAGCAHPEDAIQIASFRGPGTTIRWGHSSKWTCWTEGPEADGCGMGQCASAVTLMRARLKEKQREHYKEGYGHYPEPRTGEST